jgi:hypothetical protein
MPKSVSCALLALALVALGAACGDDSGPDLTAEEQSFCDDVEALQTDEEPADIYTAEALAQLEEYRAGLDGIEPPAALAEDWAGSLAAIDDTIAVYTDVVAAGFEPGDSGFEEFQERFDAVDTEPGDAVAVYLDDTCGIDTD